MELSQLSLVEQRFFDRSGRKRYSTRIPYVIVPNFPNLGLLTALRFLEWVEKNPNGVISLPTGKTPEHFIKWTQFFLENWDSEKAQKLMSENGFF